MTHALTTHHEGQRRALMIGCLALGAIDLAFVDGVALPRVMGTAPPPVQPHPAAVAAPPLAPVAAPPLAPVEARSADLPREAGEVGRGRPSTEDSPPESPPPEAAPAPAPAAPTLELTIHFATADATLTARTRAVLATIAARAAGHPGWTVAVQGHADARGDAAFNARLSEQRAEVVAARLHSAGLPEGRLQTAAFGATRPLAEGDDPASLRRNRRVEILIVRGAP